LENIFIGNLKFNKASSSFILNHATVSSKKSKNVGHLRRPYFKEVFVFSPGDRHLEGKYLAAQARIPFVTIDFDILQLPAC